MCQCGSARCIHARRPRGRRRAGRFRCATFLFLDGAGKEVARLAGQQPQEVLIQSLEVLAGQKCDGFRLLPTSPAEGS